MTKLLIVDDEQFERDGMEAILKKHFPGLVIEQAKNGQMAIEIAQELKPNLVLMDIKMPGMNGLEAVEKISLSDSSIQFIMVTAYDTVEYLKHAIKLGVKDYVLKPSKASEIVEIVGKVLKKIEEERYSLEKNQLQLQKTLSIVETDIVTQLLFDHVHEVHVDMLVEMLDIPSRSEMFVMLIVLPAGSEDDYSAIRETVRKMRSGWVGALYGSQLPVVVFRDPTQTYRSQATKLARELLSLGSIWFIGLGSVCHDLSQIRQSYQESLISTMDTKLPEQYCFYADVPSIKDRSSEHLTRHQKKEFSDLVRLGEWDQIDQYVMSHIQFYENEGTNLLYAQQRVLEVLWVVSRVLYEMGVEVHTPLYTYQIVDNRQLRSATHQLLYVMKQSYVKYYDRLEADTIHRLKQFIMDQSEQDISLDALGKRVGLSPIYISKMFKEKLGINYIDFLTECRMEKAKKLLADPEKSIKEITFEVGYHDPNYFSKVFKKICSVTPKEYRNTLLGKKS